MRRMLGVLGVVILVAGCESRSDQLARLEEGAYWADLRQSAACDEAATARRDAEMVASTSDTLMARLRSDTALYRQLGYRTVTPDMIARADSACAAATEAAERASLDLRAF